MLLRIPEGTGLGERPQSARVGDGPLFCDAGLDAERGQAGAVAEVEEHPGVAGPQVHLDDLGRTRTLVFGGITAAAGFTLATLVPSFPVALAGYVLVGLGCPRQEIFAYAMRPLLDMPLLAVGAAFDYHAGMLRNPPPWMQKYALEWLWRLGLEPKRLWKRYVLLNPAYLSRLAAQGARLWKATPPAPATEPLEAFPV